MADPLIRAIMKNVAEQNGKVRQKSNDASTSNIHITAKEENQLLGLINKGVYKGKKSSTNNSSYNQGRTTQKIKLEDLVGSNNKTETYIKENNNKNKTMMTLDDLANRTKNTSSNQTSTKNEISSHNNPYRQNSNKQIKSNVIGNLEAYVPKVSLSSIGKKGSLS